MVTERLSRPTARPAARPAARPPPASLIDQLADALELRLGSAAPSGLVGVLMATGEAVHILQPLLHLSLRLSGLGTRGRRRGPVRRRRRRTPLRASSPRRVRCPPCRRGEWTVWLAALAVEGSAYLLCRRAATLARRASRGAGGASAAGCSAAAGSASPDNEEELRHRRRLLLQLLLRPLLLGGVRSLLLRRYARRRRRNDDDTAEEGEEAPSALGRLLETLEGIDAVLPRFSAGGFG